MGSAGGRRSDYCSPAADLGQVLRSASSVDQVGRNSSPETRPRMCAQCSFVLHQARHQAAEVRLFIVLPFHLMPSVVEWTLFQRHLPLECYSPLTCLLSKHLRLVTLTSKPTQERICKTHEGSRHHMLATLRTFAQTSDFSRAGKV